MNDGKRQPVTAAEVIAAEEERLRTDPVYRAQTEAVAAERRALAEARALAARPIVEDLRAAGFDVDSVWSLDRASNRYPEAFPILLAHLQRGGYPDDVMMSLGQALAVKSAATVWDAVRELYLAAEGRWEKDGLAAALAASAAADRLDELISLLDETSRGASRIHFLRPILRVGGARGLDVVKSLRDDPLFGEEAQARLKRRKV